MFSIARNSSRAKRGEQEHQSAASDSGMSSRFDQRSVSAGTCSVVPVTLDDLLGAVDRLLIVVRHHGADRRNSQARVRATGSRPAGRWAIRYYPATLTCLSPMLTCTAGTRSRRASGSAGAAEPGFAVGDQPGVEWSWSTRHGLGATGDHPRRGSKRTAPTSRLRSERKPSCEQPTGIRLTGRGSSQAGGDTPGIAKAQR